MTRFGEGRGERAKSYRSNVFPSLGQLFLPWPEPEPQRKRKRKRDLFVSLVKLVNKRNRNAPTSSGRMI